MPSDSVIALIMAAGLSQRFGGDKRKARLPNGDTLLQATVALAQSSFNNVCIVLGERDSAAELRLPSATPIIRAPGQNIGLGTSISSAFQHLLATHNPAKSAAVMLGDMPWTQSDSIGCLTQQATALNIVRPEYRKQPGHPVLFGRAFWPLLTEVSGDDGAKDVVSRYRSSCVRVVVEDEGVVRDVDWPGDLEG